MTFPLLVGESSLDSLELLRIFSPTKPSLSNTASAVAAEEEHVGFPCQTEDSLRFKSLGFHSHRVQVRIVSFYTLPSMFVLLKKSEPSSFICVAWKYISFFYPFFCVLWTKKLCCGFFSNINHIWFCNGWVARLKQADILIPFLYKMVILEWRKMWHLL